ncbi:MAG: hypothetical protein OEY80_09665 [Nitrospirota bacterium]|nr:hypothetical protein [Nitrospirota bacterium]
MHAGNLHIQGLYRDMLKDADNRLVSDSGWRSNTILNGCRILLAGFMKNESVMGIQSLAVGQGNVVWDTDGVPAPNPETTTALENPAALTIPFADLEIVFLDHKDQAVNTPTPRLQITATLKPGFPAPIAPTSVYPLREFGLWGRLGSKDFLINNIRHPVLLKDNTSTLIRIIRLYF